MVHYIMCKPIKPDVRFCEVLEHYLNRGLQVWANETVNKNSFEGMYEHIEKSIFELFSKTSFNFTTDTKRWITQQLYLGIRFSTAGSVVLSDGSNLKSPPKIFDSVDIRLIPNDELRLCAGIFSETEFAIDIITEIRRRA